MERGMEGAGKGHLPVLNGINAARSCISSGAEYHRSGMNSLGRGKHVSTTQPVSSNAIKTKPNVQGVGQRRTSPETVCRNQNRNTAGDTSPIDIQTLRRRVS